MFGLSKHAKATLCNQWLSANRLESVPFWVALAFCLAIAGCTKPLESIPVGTNPGRAVITRDGSQIFVAQSENDSITVISVRHGQPLAIASSISLDGGPGPLSISPDGRTLYVGIHRASIGNQEKGAVEAIDTGTKRVELSIRTPGPVRDMALSPDGESIYLAMERAGLGKLSLVDNKLAIIDKTQCPEGLAITSQGSLFVSYQCTGILPDSTRGVGTWGHDPFAIFDTKTDSLKKWIKSNPSMPFPNVGSQMALAPDETQIWENGSDACSRKKTAKDPNGYDFEGCPQDIEDWRGRAVINIIDVVKGEVVGTKGFVGKLPGSNYILGASDITFFPAICHFEPDRVAVSTEQDVLIFDENSRNQYAANAGVPPIRSAGNILFSPDCQFAYVVSSSDNRLHVRSIEKNGTFGRVQPTRPFQAALKSYKNLWLGHYALSAALHSLGIVVLFYLIAFLSPRFAHIVGRWPLLSRPLEFDVVVRKQNSVLIQLYVRQLKEEVSRSLTRVGATKIVPLPLERMSSGTGSHYRIDTHKWVEELVRIATTSNKLRASLEGHGGDGKSILIQCLLKDLIAKGNCVPVLLQGVNYDGESSLTSWLQRTLDMANVPVKSEVLRSLPSLVVVIDGVSEVPRAKQENFWKLISAQFEEPTEARKLIIAGRFIGNPETGTGSSLEWDDSAKFDALGDDVITELAIAYLDPGGPSGEIESLPAQLRQIAGRPNAFIVSYYVRIRKAAAGTISTKRDLYERVLERFVIEKNPVVRPDVLKAVLQALVGKFYGATGNRGLPGSTITLTEKVNDVFKERNLTDLYGPGNIPPAATFVDYLIHSGLVERVGDRYVFFHDSFEDWLLGETG